MSASVIKDALVTVLSGVTGIVAARVYRRQILFRDDKATRDTLCGVDATDPGTVNAWFISVTGFTDVAKSIGQTGQNAALYTVNLLGYASINSTSEEAFELLCERVRDAVAAGLRAQLAPASAGCHVRQFPSVVIGYAAIPVFGGIFVHKASATLTLELWHSRG